MNGPFTVLLRRLARPGRRGWFVPALIGLIALGGLGGTMGAGRPVAAVWRSAAPLTIGRGERVVIFAPHPDDETLAAGGVIQEVLRQGGTVRLVIMTNGDGFRVAAEKNLRKIHLRRADFLALGRRRQVEARQAAGELGLAPGRVTFLGFPDRGLAHLWTSDWNDGQPYRSGYTGATSVPYALAWRPATPYTKAMLVAQIREILRQERPDRVFVPAAFDNHPDHWATGLFVAYAMAENQADGGPAAGRGRLYTYVVHAPGWPSPLGLDTIRAGEPRFPKTGDSPWVRFTLTPDQAAAKRRAIGAHSSQVAVMARFLYSFAGNREYFQELPIRILPYLPGTGPQPALDLVKDGVMSTLVETGVIASPAGRVPPVDVRPRSLAGAADRRNLYLRLRLAGPVSRGASLRVDLVGAGGEGGSRQNLPVTVRRSGARHTAAVLVTIPGNAADGQVHPAAHGSLWSLAGDTLLLSVPRRAVGGAGTIFVGVRAFRQGRETGSLPWVFCVLDGV